MLFTNSNVNKEEKVTDEISRWIQETNMSTAWEALAHHHLTWKAVERTWKVQQ